MHLNLLKCVQEGLKCLHFGLYDNMFVNIYDLMGRSILNKRIVGQTTQMDLSGFINNVYIIQIVQNKELIYNEKIYKN